MNYSFLQIVQEITDKSRVFHVLGANKYVIQHFTHSHSNKNTGNKTHFQNKLKWC